MNKIDSLDGLRAIAVLLVLIAHFPDTDAPLIVEKVRAIAANLGAGYLGVEVFFVLSGFLITRILLAQRDKSGRTVLKEFYIKRILRILPIFYLTIVACLILFPAYNYFYPSVFLSNYYFSFDQSIGAKAHPLRHFWSLAVEEQYYLFWPLIIIFFKFRTKHLIYVLVSTMAISICVSFARNIFYEDAVSNALIYRGLESRMLALSMGGLLAVTKVPAINSKVLFALVGLLFASYYGLVNFGKQIGLPFLATKAIIFAAMAWALFVLCHNSKGLLQSLLVVAPMRYIGKISYGLYVYHIPILYLFGFTHMQNFDGRLSSLQACTVIFCIFFTAIASWHLFENPILKLRSKLL